METWDLHRGCYISALVLFIEQVEEKRYNELIKFNNTGARMLDSIYHMTLKLLKDRILA